MSNHRAHIITIMIFLGFAIVGVRLGDLMLFEHDKLAEKAKYQRIKKKRLKAGRGGIYDRRGRELAVNVEAVSVYANPSKVSSPGQAARAISKTTGRSVESTLKSLASERKFVWITRKLDRRSADELKGMGIAGLGFVPELKRYYPKGSMASHIVGFVGVDNQPLEGIELEYDAVLRGEEQKVVLVRDAGGRTLSGGGIRVEMGGSDVILTIDEGLQYIVEQALVNGIDRSKGKAGSAIMMDPYTGEVLAMANYPFYDLNSPGGVEVGHRRNRAIIDPYEPGSTFKVVTASAVLEKGVADFSTLVDASRGYVDIADRRVWDTHNKGILTFKDVIKTSSNVGTILVSRKLESAALYEYVKKFGFGFRTGVDIPGENPGLVHGLEQWSETSHAALSIGYEVAATPLQVLRAYSVIANGGVLVRPRMVKDVITHEGHSIHNFGLTGMEEGERIISASTAARLRDVLVTVTEKGGTAVAASIDGNAVAGKTGTTRLIDPETGKYSKEKYASSFVGFVPAHRPRLALIVVIFEPEGEYYGGVVAAPVFRDIVGQSLAYLNVPREDRVKDSLLFVSHEAAGESMYETR